MLKTGIAFDTSVNTAQFEYSSNGKKVTLVGQSCTTRTPFLVEGRHHFNLKIHKNGHVGIGVVSRKKSFALGQYLGHDTESWGTWDDIADYHAGVHSTTPLTKSGDVVGVELDLNRGTLKYSINGTFFDGVRTNLPKEVALAASLWKAGDCVEIIQHVILYT